MPAPESLEAELERLRAKSKRDDATIERLEKEIRDLRHRLDLFIRNFISGKKGEAIDPKQLELALQGLAAVLTQAQRDDFWRDGFLVVENAVTAEHLAA